MSDFFVEIRSFISQNKYLLLKVKTIFSLKVQQLTSIVLNFWTVIRKNKKIYEFFCKNSYFFILSRSRIFLRFLY